MEIVITLLGLLCGKSQVHKALQVHLIVLACTIVNVWYIQQSKSGAV